jgi:hypothetical protein
VGGGALLTLFSYITFYLIYPIYLLNLLLSFLNKVKPVPQMFSVDNRTSTSSTLDASHTLRAALTEALQDEYRARAVYRQTLEQFGDRAPFANIVQAEERHIQALLPLFVKYGIPIPADESAQHVILPDSVQSVCEVGVRAEIANAAMYDRLLATTAAYPDVQRVFTQLQRASQTNHLPAFQRCLAQTIPLTTQVTAPSSGVSQAAGLSTGVQKAAAQTTTQSGLWLLGLSAVIAGLGWIYWYHRQQSQTQHPTRLRDWVQQLSPPTSATEHRP